MMSSLIRFRYHPLTEVDRLFADAFNARSWPSPSLRVERATSAQASFHPRMDVEESTDANTVTATFELPGLKPEDVAIDLRETRLTVSGESSVADSHKGDGHAVRERRYGKFSRTLQVPFGIKPEDVKAQLENGLLTVTFPKATPEQQSQRIAIQ